MTSGTIMMLELFADNLDTQINVSSEIRVKGET